MNIGSKITEGSVRHYRLVTAVTVAVTLAVALAAGLPSLLGRRLGVLQPIQVDTDPENMLAENEPVRVFHNAMKRRMDLHDMVVVGVVRADHPHGVFTPESLAKIKDLADFAARLNGDTEFGRRYGLKSGQRVIEPDLISPSRVDTVEPLGPDTVSVHPLMPRLPADQAQADAVLAAGRRVPFLHNTLVSADGKAIALYLPLTSKDISYRVYQALKDHIATLGGPEEFHVTGLPVAEDTFGVEMFIQMAISAPTAMAVIFLLMLAFFRKLVVIVSPMIVALVSVILTMGALVMAGFPIHIMSSMIPIFIMPIAVLDSIHIISEFFERYQATRDRRQTLRAVMDELFTPMLYTSLTSAAGFASLALTPIPPVQVFGMFVAAGIMVAWALTVTFIPAFVMFIPERRLANFGARHVAGEHAHDTALTRFLRWTGGATYRRAKPLIAVAAVVLVVAGYGISRIQINDNPIKWFTPSHPIRQADTVLNRHFGGTYMAYLAMEYDPPAFDPADYAEELTTAAGRRAEAVLTLVAQVPAQATAAAAEATDTDAFFKALKDSLRPDVNATTDEALSAWTSLEGFLDRRWDAMTFAETPVAFDPVATPARLAAQAEQFAQAVRQRLGALAERTEQVAADKPANAAAFLDALRRHDASVTDDPLTAAAAGEAVSLFLQEQARRDEVFKRPDVLAHMRGLESAMGNAGVVGKVNSVAGIVETVNRDLHGGDPNYLTVPPTRQAVGSCLTQFQSGKRPYLLWHFVTKDYRTASLWVQLTSGDNKDMSRVVAAVNDHLAAHDAPVPLTHRWFGLTYINVIWQEKMVRGMLESFAGSFLVVLLLMVILFRSALWGLLSMVPLTVTIAAIYGAIGLVGKDYDMPVAVLSSLTLGLAVDFAIHFLARSRAMFAATGSWQQTAPAVFGEPARAIARNIIVIAAGFLPLLAAPLMPYKTVGVLLATILLVGGVATLLLLPALVRVLAGRLFAPRRKVMNVVCNCGTCVVSAVLLSAALALNAYQLLEIKLMPLTIVSMVAIPVLALLCGWLSRRRKCQLQNINPEAPHESNEEPS